MPTHVQFHHILLPQPELLGSMERRKTAGCLGVHRLRTRCGRRLRDLIRLENPATNFLLFSRRLGHNHFTLAHDVKGFRKIFHEALVSCLLSKSLLQILLFQCNLLLHICIVYCGAHELRNIDGNKCFSLILGTLLEPC